VSSVIKKIDFLPEPLYTNTNIGQSKLLKPDNFDEMINITTPTKKKLAEELNFNSPTKSKAKSNRSNGKILKSCLKTPSPCKKRKYSSKKKLNVSFRNVAVTSDNKIQPL
jgi:hypothetical protein